MSRTHTPSTRSAFTLIETVVSLVIVSVLMLGLSSSVMLGSFALPSASEMGESDREVHAVVALLRDELRRASAMRYRTASGGVQIKLTLKTTGETGEPSSASWIYDKASSEIRYQPDADSAVVLLENVSSVSVTLIQDGSELRVLHLVMVVDGTIQKTFECHFLLPDMPGVS